MSRSSNDGGQAPRTFPADSSVEELRRRRFRTLADENRLLILRLLWSGPKPFSELCDALPLEQSHLSHQLKIMRDAKLVVVMRKGRQKIYDLYPGIRGSESQVVLELGTCRIWIRQPPEPGWASRRMSLPSDG